MMWKPGTRVVCVKSVKYPQSVGACATVIDESQFAIDDRTTSVPRPPLCVRMDESIRHIEGGYYADWRTWPKNWRKLDGNDSTGITSVEALKRTLTQPTEVT